MGGGKHIEGARETMHAGQVPHESPGIFNPHGVNIGKAVCTTATYVLGKERRIT